MKKNITIKNIFLSLFLITTLLTSCNIELEEENKYDPPTCSVQSENSINIAIKKYNSDTKYINIYRKDTTDSPNAQFINIGMIFPDNLPKEQVVNTFTDFLVKNGHSYVYYARIFDGNEYIKTQDTDEIKIPNTYKCFPDTDTFKYGTATFTYDKEDYTIKITGIISAPNFTNPPTTFDYKPALIVSSSKKAEVFSLNSISDGDTLSLRNILSNDFLNTEIKIEGICGQQIEHDESENIKRVYWTEPTQISVTGDGIKNNKLTVKDSSNISGFDYSRQIIYQ